MRLRGSRFMFEGAVVYTADADTRERGRREPLERKIQSRYYEHDLLIVPTTRPHTLKKNRTADTSHPPSNPQGKQMHLTEEETQAHC